MAFQSGQNYQNTLKKYHKRNMWYIKGKKFKNSLKVIVHKKEISISNTLNRK